MVRVIEGRQTLQLINAAEARPIEEWRTLYPDLWLFIEVTREDPWEVYEGKLVAVAEDPIELVEVAKSYDERGVVNLTTGGDYTQPQPALIA